MQVGSIRSQWLDQLADGEEILYCDDFFCVTKGRLFLGKTTLRLIDISSVDLYTKPANYVPSILILILMGGKGAWSLAEGRGLLGFLGGLGLILLAGALAILAMRKFGKQNVLSVIDHSGHRHTAMSRDPDHLSHVATFINEAIFSPK
jgi:hypothetical protein